MEFTELLSASMADEFRTVAFAELIRDPLRWRVRRVDSFRSAEWIAVEQLTKVDVRLRHGFIRAVLSRLGEGYEVEQRVDDLAAVTGLTNSVERHAVVNPPITSVDVLVPLLWRDGPTLQNEVRLGGDTVPPLNRREAADVIARFFRSQLAGAASVQAVPDEPVDGLWTAIGWCLAATDSASLRERSALSRLGGTDPDQDFLAIREWMAETYVSSCGCTKAQAEELLQSTHDWILDLVARSLALRPFWRTLECDTLTPEGAAFNPALNPLLMHYSHLKYVRWIAHKAEGRYVLPVDLAGYVSCRFLGLCTAWIELLERVAADVRQPGDSSGESLARASVLFASRIGASWPMIVRVALPLERTLRFEITSALPTQTAARYSSEYDLTGRRPWIWLRMADLLSRRPARVAVNAWRSILRLVSAGHLGRAGSRLTQSYPIVLHDSQSYHIEVLSPSAALELCPDGAYIKTHHREYGFAWIARIAQDRWLEMMFPLRKIAASGLFGRTTCGGTRAHHFYTTKTRGWGDSSTEGAHLFGSASTLPYLVVGYHVKRSISWSNAMASLAVLAGSVLLMRAVLFEIVGLNPGHLDVIEFARALAPAILTVLILFAVERHNNMLVSGWLRRWVIITLLAFVVFLAALLLRAWLLDPGAIPTPAIPESEALGELLDRLRAFLLTESTFLARCIAWFAGGVVLFLFAAPLAWACVTLGGILWFAWGKPLIAAIGRTGSGGG